MWKVAGCCRYFEDLMGFSDGQIKSMIIWLLISLCKKHCQGLFHNEGLWATKQVDERWISEERKC